MFLWNRDGHDGQKFGIEYSGEDITKVPTMSRFFSNTINGFRDGVQFVFTKPSDPEKAMEMR